MSKILVFTNWSGGIDSTHTLYHMLLNRPDCRILAHHCVFQAKEGRWQEESEAVENIREWFRQKGLPRVNYMESKVDLGFLKCLLYDIEVMAFLTGGILRAHGGRIAEVVMSTSKDDFEQPEFHVRHKSRLDLIRTVSKRPDVPILFPNEHKSRREVIAELPPDLLKLCWFCRTPRESEPCGKCKTCLQTLPILAELGIS